MKDNLYRIIILYAIILIIHIPVLIYFKNTILHIILTFIIALLQFVSIIIAIQIASKKKELSREAFSAITFIIFSLIYLFGSIYYISGLNYNGTIIHSYPEALYFSIVTLTTLGYGDFQPTELARVFASFQALLGYICMGLYVGFSLSYFSKTTTSNEKNPPNSPCPSD